MKLICVGGGPAGLYLAILMKLHDPRHDIAIVERNAPAYTHGWGVVFWDDLLETLQRSDPESARMITASARRWASQIVEIEDRQTFETSKYCGYSIGRQRLLDILTDRATGLGVRIEFEREVLSLSELPECDLVIGCDGANSRVRELNAGQFGTKVHVGRNKYLWLATDRVFGSFTFAFARTNPGWIWCHAYGVDSNFSTFIVECPPEVWGGLGFDAMSAEDTLAALTDIFKRQLDGHRLFGRFGESAGVPWQNFRSITNKDWHAGNIVLMGDAAHTTHFTIGSGTKLAIEDAVTLADKLQKHRQIHGALDAYTRGRQAAMLQLQSEARLSAQWFESVSRYLELEPDQFFTLLLKRRSPLLRHLSPRLYLGILRGTEENAVLRALRRQIWPRARAFYNRRGAAS